MTRISHRGAALAAALLAVLAVPLLAACTADRGEPTPPGPAGGTAQTATVTRGDIQSTLVLDAKVIAGGTYDLTAPVAGTIASISTSGVEINAGNGKRVSATFPSSAGAVSLLAKVGQNVAANYPVARIEVTTFVVLAELAPASLYRLYQPVTEARAQIKEGPGPFACPLIDRVPAQADAGHRVACLVPADVTVFTGMPANLAITTGQVKNVLTLPVNAVAGSAKRGQVRARNGDQFELRDVTLGLTDGRLIEIISGLKEGDVVSVPGPDLRPGG